MTRNTRISIQHVLQIMAVTVCLSSFQTVQSFLPTPHTSTFLSHPTRDSKTILYSSYSTFTSLKKRSIQLPLIDLSISTKDSETSQIIIPLPSSHLPSELSTPHIYGMELSSPLYTMMITDLMTNSKDEKLYGCVASKGEDLVGAIGCAATILIATPNDNNNKEEQQTSEEEKQMMVLSKGAFRFIVTEVIQSYPYVIAVVDELLDYAPGELERELKMQQQKDQEECKAEEETSGDCTIVEYDDFADSNMFFQTDTPSQEEEEEEEDDDISDLYPNYTPSQLFQTTLTKLHSYIHTQLESTSQPKSILEQHILETQNFSPDNLSSQFEEMAAILELLPSEILDIAPLEWERFYTIGMLAAEMISVENTIRKDLLKTRNGVDRMKIVLRELERKEDLARTKKLTMEISEQSILKDRGDDDLIEEEKGVKESEETKTQEEEEDSVVSDGGDAKDLKVGTPSLPPWASSLKKGLRVEYYWNDLEGWCGGVITNDPVRIVNEIILEITFDDGEVHRIPFLPEEKVRWRPGS